MAFASWLASAPSEEHLLQRWIYLWGGEHCQETWGVLSTCNRQVNFCTRLIMAWPSLDSSIPYAIRNLSLPTAVLALSH